MPVETSDADTVTSTVVVPLGSPFVGDLNVVGLGLSHEAPDDLHVTLVSPAGTRVALFADICVGDVWRETSFDLDDEAALAVGSECPPGEGVAYVPVRSLDAFDGERSAGTWTLEVRDDTENGSSGRLDAWALDIAATTPILVNSTNDVDDTACNVTHCSLREAINRANAQAGGDSIHFNIAGAGIKTITPGSALPTFTGPAIVDGTTQPGFAGTPLIELSGGTAGTGTHGLRLTGGDSVVRGLIVNGFDGDGVALATNGRNLVEGNYIGTNAAGTAHAGNNGHGITVTGTADNTIGGTTAAARNVISGNNFGGVTVDGAGASGNVVAGNRIGTNAAGTTAVGNHVGVFVIGGAPGVRVSDNVISGGSVGVSFEDAGAGGIVEGNLVGTDATGSVDLGNSLYGIWVLRTANTSIGGATAGERNVVSGNNNTGITVSDAGATGTMIKGNYVGLNGAGTAALANGSGIFVANGSDDTQVGGPAAGEGNVVSGNTGHGIRIDSFPAGATNASVLGNKVGTNAAGSAPIPNGATGIFVSNADGNTIGGTDSGAGNVIAHNGREGIEVVSGTGNSIRGNSVFSNTRLGINIGNDSGVTLNDAGDADSGANALQNFPELGSVTRAASTTVTGVLKSTASATFAVDFYASTACDTSLHGEGQRYIGSATATTDATGQASFTEVIPTAIGATEVVTATATDAAGNTSELGPCAPAPVLVANSADDADDGVCDVVHCSLREAINVANLTTGANDIDFSIGTGAQTIAVSTALPAITSPIDLDATTQPGFAGAPLIELTKAPFTSSDDGLHITAGSSVVRGFVINSFNGDGIELATNGGNRIEGNYIGTNAAGTAKVQNGLHGIRVTNSPGNTLGGTTASARNVISGNNSHGIAIEGAGGSGNAVQGNYIGTNAAGAGSLPNFIGVIVQPGPSGTTIGGTAAGAGNVISGNTSAGIVIQDAAAGHTIQGNLVGTDAAGTADLGNGLFGMWILRTDDVQIGGTSAAARNVISGNAWSGIEISAVRTIVQGNYIGTDAAGTADLGNSIHGIRIVAGAADTTIGGAASGAGNVISGNDAWGVMFDVFPAATTNVTVQGNRIGTNAAATAALANAQGGIQLVNGHGNTIGGTAAGAGNIVAGNSGTGVLVNSDGNTIQGNFIGTNSTGTVDLRNLSIGLWVLGSRNTVGGTATGAGNTVAFNAGSGIRVNFGTQNALRRNSIYSNSGLGIDLQGDGITANDPGDADTGANNFQNYPELSEVATGTGSTTVEGGLSGAASTTYDLDFYVNPSCDASGAGEGKTLLGSASVTTNASGAAVFSQSFATGIAATDSVSATATDPDGNTSELSNCVEPGELVVTSAGDGADTNTTDAFCADANGSCTLRAAINHANATAEDEIVHFSIASGAKTIAPASALPTITDSLTLDATTQPGFAGPSPVELDGTGAGAGTTGLRISAGSSTVRGFVINRFAGDGVHLAINGANVIEGNRIGTDRNGTLDHGNAGEGIRITNSPGNTIGGLSGAARNVISGNDSDGIQIEGATSTGNVVRFNFIGTSASGGSDLGNAGTGVFLNGVDDTVVGPGNVLSGNDFSGVDIWSPGADNVVAGNFIGTNAAGSGDVGNAFDGVLVRSGATSNTIGGPSAAARNVISGNDSDAVELVGNQNVVQGNYVGLNASGSAALANSGTGIFVNGASSTLIGGAVSGATNVVSANGFAGIEISGGGSQTTVQGNLIGTDAAGTADRGNTVNGIRVRGGGTNNLIGGTTTAARNVVSGNNSHGIMIEGTTATGNRIEGNYVGTTVAGTAALANSGDGVLLFDAVSNTIGGTAAGARNLISGNNGSGLRIEGRDTANFNQVIGNYVGTNVTGTAALANFGTGVTIRGGNDNIIGGTAAGSRNVISGNRSNGVLVTIVGGGARGNRIQGNHIGTNVAGSAAIPNGTGGFAGGVLLFASSTTVGGTTATARNVISGNVGFGIRTISSAGNTIQGNYIGTDSTGAADLGNTVDGILLEAVTTVGGAAPGAGNVISGNGRHGVHAVSTVGRNVIAGNLVGTNAAGTGALGNDGAGVSLVGSPSNTVGGTTAGTRNVISGNQVGIATSGTSATANLVLGNYVGTNASGNAAVGNDVGVSLGGPATIVGGSEAGAANVISGNDIQGVLVTPTGTGERVQGNLIGTNAAATGSLPNGAAGVELQGSDNAVGGPGAGEGNLIAFNSGPGVSVTGTAARNAIRGNSLRANGGPGVDLGADGVTANDAGDADSGPNNLQNFPEVTDAVSAGGSTTVEGWLQSTPGATYDVDFYANVACDPSGYGESERYLGSASVTTDGAGTAVFHEELAATLAIDEFVVAQATDEAGTSSELGPCHPTPPLVVNSANDVDDGSCNATHCSLREAIIAANATTGIEAIRFSIATGPQTIAPTSALPTITKPVIVNGRTQPGYAGTPIIELNGAAAGTNADGLRISAGGSTVRGLVINRFGGDGIELVGGSGSFIQGNYVGTDVAGAADLGNGRNGIFLNGSAANMIGGVATGAGNLVSGNGQRGVDLVGAATGNRVFGNLIGTNAGGSAKLGNSSDGVRITNAAGNFIGGIASQARNLISGNALRGVAILGSAAAGNIVRGNSIGTNAAATANLGNVRHGVLLTSGASGNTIGGAAANAIANNGGSGVAVVSGTANAIRRNAIFANAGLGIDLGATGVDANDAGDEDTGPNDLQNFPLIGAITVAGGQTTVQGTIASTPETTFRLYLYVSAACDPSGNGEAREFLGTAVVTTDEFGDGSFAPTYARTISSGQVVTATATAPSGSTSELSPCATVPDPSISAADVSPLEGINAAFTVRLSAPSSKPVTVAYATADDTAVAGNDYTSASGTLTFSAGQTVRQLNVATTQDALDEDNETFTLVLSAPTNATVADGEALATIRDDDPAPTISINDVSVTEPDPPATVDAVFTVSLSAASAKTVTVKIASANGTALTPSDYVAVPLTTLTFAPGETVKTVTLTVNGDNTIEGNETAFANLSAATNAAIADSQGKLTILNDD